MEMPRYKSHKVVQAIEVKTVELPKTEQEATIVTFVESEFNDKYPSADALMRYKPKSGDFLVVYNDGYQSFSPRKAFLEGYTRETQIHPVGSQT